MGLIKKIGAVIIDHLTTEQSFKDGQQFEDYILKYLFPSKYYILVHKTHDHKTNKERFVEDSLLPDFKFRDRLTGKEFYIEAKFRSTDYNNKIIWCNDKQLQRYQSVNKITPVFLLLGTEGKPGLPDYLSLIPMEQAKYTGLFTYYVDKFYIEIDEPVKSKRLWNFKAEV